MKDIMERFYAKLDKHFPLDFNVCWNWTGAKRRGYGQFAVTSKKIVSAHRFAYEQFIGKIPDGLILDHMCRNRACVNPLHLEPVTYAEIVVVGLVAPLLIHIKRIAIGGMNLRRIIHTIRHLTGECAVSVSAFIVLNGGK